MTRRLSTYTRWSFNYPLEEVIPEGYVYGISYALFGIDSQSGRILASRAPTGEWQLGQSLYRQNPFSSEAIAWFRSSERRPLLIMTKHGMGLLSKRYLIPCGLGLLIHFHAPAARAAAMACRGLLPRQWLISKEVQARGGGRCDEETYRTVAEAAYELTDRLPALFPTGPDRRPYLREVATGIRRMATAIGCVGREVADGDVLPCQQVLCSRPLAFEAFLLYGLTLADRMTADGHFTFMLNPPHALAPESLSIRLDMELSLMHNAYPGLPRSGDPDGVLERLLTGYHCLRHAASFNGSVLQATVGSASLDPNNRRRERRHLTLEMSARSDPFFDHRLSLRSSVAELFEREERERESEVKFI